MIALPFGAILALFVSVPLLVISILSLFYNVRTRHRRGRAEESIYRCSQCGHVYTFARYRPMDRCPRCDHLNEAVRV